MLNEMIPKERAKQIVDRFSDLGHEEAKKYALIFVDDLIEILETLEFPNGTSNAMIIWYWQSVRKHINYL